MFNQSSHHALYGGTAPLGISDVPLIINACLTGNIPTRQNCPSAPLSVAEIIEDAARVIEAGASMLHIHARDSEGAPTWRPEVYGRIFEGIRRISPETILIATTSGRIHGGFEQRAAVLDLDGVTRPDMASLSLGSMNFPRQPSVNSPETIQALCSRMRERDILPELEAFEPGMLNYAFYLQRKGFLPGRCYINFMLGSLGTAPGRLSDLCAMVRELPKEWIWAGAGIGQYQLPINTGAILMGGHVRVGVEDNLFYDYPNRVPASNLALTQRVVRLAREFGRPVATAAEVRSLLRLGDHENWRETTVTLRKMVANDRPAVLDLLGRWNMAPIAPSAERPDPERSGINLASTFVAQLRGRIVGVASYLPIDEATAETASLAVDPDYLGCGIGYRLQEARLDEMRRRGIRRVRTEADRPETIHWYVDRFGYRIVGTAKKRHPFSRLDRDAWTVLELDLQ